LYNIINKLDLTNYLKIRLVCKRWKRITDSELLISKFSLSNKLRNIIIYKYYKRKYILKCNHITPRIISSEFGEVVIYPTFSTSYDKLCKCKNLCQCQDEC